LGAAMARAHGEGAGQADFKLSWARAARAIQDMAVAPREARGPWEKAGFQGDQKGAEKQMLPKEANEAQDLRSGVWRLGRAPAARRRARQPVKQKVVKSLRMGIVQRGLTDGSGCGEQVSGTGQPSPLNATKQVPPTRTGSQRKTSHFINHFASLLAVSGSAAVNWSWKTVELASQPNAVALLFLLPSFFPHASALTTQLAPLSQRQKRVDRPWIKIASRPVGSLQKLRRARRK
jgi:hypothetical protein